MCNYVSGLGFQVSGSNSKLETRNLKLFNSRLIYDTVTDLAKERGRSTSLPRATAVS